MQTLDVKDAPAPVRPAPAPPRQTHASGSGPDGPEIPDGHTPTLRRIGLVAGPLAFVLMALLPPPGTLSLDGWRTAGIAVWMAIWWLTEGAPIPVTALLPLVVLPAIGVLTVQEASAPYANELIFLFMGGFFLATAMERWSVHKRMALWVLGRVGTSPPRLVLGFMAATAFISMWINNTATTAMMLPIALAVGAMLRPDGGEQGRPYNFGIALMLGIAYASSIGGVGTLIGTAPNALFAAAALELTGTPIGFVEWMMVGVPVVLVMLPLTWLILVKVFPPGDLRGDAADVLERERRSQGRMVGGEKFVAWVFALTVAAWVLRAPKEMGSFTIPGLADLLPGLTDSMIAIGAAVVLMAVPVDWRRGTAALEWEQAARIPWGVLLLFGGGLSLAQAMSASGLAVWIGGGVTMLEALPLLVVVAAVSTLFVFLTEVTSNTAVTAMAMPVMAGVALTLGVEPVVLMATAAIACSMAFMLPAGTPPNAIVFSSGYIRVAQMARAGLWVNFLSILTVTLAGRYLVPALFGN